MVVLTLSSPASRSRSRVTTSQDTSYADHCEDCDCSDKDIAYCNVCESSFCASCWSKQLSHKKNKLGPGGLPHEKTLPSIAKKVRNALEPPADETTRAKLCQEDEITTWFGRQLL
jgi:hypothetical protein